MDRFLKGTLCVANLVLVTGIVGAALGDSDRAFDLAFWLRGWPQASLPPDVNLAQLTTDSACTPTPGAQMLTVEQAAALQRQWLQGARFRDLAQVEQVLGIPACRTENGLTYGVENQGRLVFAGSGQEMSLAWLPTSP